MSDIPEKILDAYGDRDDFIECEKRRAAIFGYHLRDKEVEELKKVVIGLDGVIESQQETNEALLKRLRELEEQISYLKVIADDE